MRIIHRHLLGELVLNALFAFVVLSSIMGMVVFSIVTLKQSLASLSVSALLEIVALMSAERLDIILPMTVLIATVWTYGRSHADGEITAMRGAGIPIRQIILPALAMGAVVCVGLAWLQDEIIPESHYRQRIIGRQFIADNIGALLENRQRRIKDKRFECLWKGDGVDEDGYRILRDVVVIRYDENGQNPVDIRAREASPRFDESSGDIVLFLRGVVQGEDLSSEQMTVRIDLSAISDDVIPNRRVTNLSYEELLTLAHRDAGGKGRWSLADYHKRGANALAAILFAMLGAPLGLVLRIRNRAYVFIIGFIIVLLFHFGPLAATFNLAREGRIPAALVWAGDGVVAAIATALYWKARRR